jgi:hypothetical protein
MGGLFAQMWALQQQRAEQTKAVDGEEGAEAGEHVSEVRVAR